MTEKQEYMTPEELGLTQEQYCALAVVQDKLERNELVHVPYPYSTAHEYIGDVFNMAEWGDTYSCGTVCCIGGWGERLTNSDIWSGRASKILNDLFYPNDPTRHDVYDSNWTKITGQQAAKAIDNFRRFGEPRWGSILFSQEKK